MCVEVRAIEAHYTVAPGLLRHVESVVGRSHQSFLVLHLRVRSGGHTTAHRPAERAALICKCMILYLLPQPLGERNRGVQDGARQNQQKLLSAVSTDPVYLTRLVLEQVRNLLQHCIAGQVAVLVVHTLELVDVAHHERDGLVQTN